MIAHKDVHWLYVTMYDLGCMKGLQALTDLHEVLPDDFFWESLFQLISLLDESAQVAIRRILHYNAEQVTCIHRFWLQYKYKFFHPACMQVLDPYHLGKPHGISQRSDA